ncbi:MAG: hypothetical protein DRO13_04470 [Thermoprotei archaeon]|nr:MAG: hypothetical protein DRO13_04470 [Thermoprotei archaeon]
MKTKRELLGYLMEYEYITEKAANVAIAVCFLIVLLIIPNWPTTLVNYVENPATMELSELGNSILSTTLILATGLTAYLVPHFEPMLKPRSFRELRDKKTRDLYLAVIASVVSITVLAYFLLSLFTAL